MRKIFLAVVVLVMINSTGNCQEPSANSQPDSRSLGDSKYIKYPGVYFKVEGAYIQDLTKYFLANSKWPQTAKDMQKTDAISLIDRFLQHPFMLLDFLKDLWPLSDPKSRVPVDSVFLDWEKAIFKNEEGKFVLEYPWRMEEETGLLKERTLNYFIFDDSVCHSSREFCLSLGKKPKAEFLVRATNSIDGLRRLEFQFVR